MSEMRLLLGRCRQVVEHRKVVSSLMRCALAVRLGDVHG